MREIKFRAWSKEDEKMRYHAEQAANGHHQMNDIYHFHQLLDSPKYELMQYTGLKDKNGTDIYEGDIFSVEDETEYEYSGRFASDPEICKVVYSDEWAAFCVASLGGEIYDRVVEYTDLAVVGNIYEKKKLLEQF